MSKRQKGRPTKLTPKLQAAICKELAKSLLPMKYACAKVGIDESTLHRWRTRAEAGETAYGDFFKAIEEAQAKGVAAQYQDPSLDAKFKLKIHDPKTFNPADRVVIENELAGAVARLKERFRNGERISLEDALSAIAGESGAGGAPKPPSGPPGGDDPASGGRG